MRAAVLALLAGCAHAARPAASTQLPEVRLVVEFREPVTCYVPDPPDAPETPPVLTSQDEPDVIARTMVHMRTYSNMVKYVDSLAQWSKSVNACLENLRERLSEKGVTVAPAAAKP